MAHQVLGSRIGWTGWQTAASGKVLHEFVDPVDARMTSGASARRIIRLVLKAGVLEDGVVSVSARGTGQGSVISPLLANIYLHYVSRSLGRALATARGHGDIPSCAMPTTLSSASSTRAMPGAFWTRCASGYRSLRCRFIPRRPGSSSRRLPRGTLQAARARQTGDLQLPGLHLHLRQNPRG